MIKQEKAKDIEKCIHLCFNGKQADFDDVFSIVEHGSQILSGTKTFSDSVLLSNFLDCYDEPTSNSSKKTLRQAIIARAFVRKSCEVSSDKSLEDIMRDRSSSIDKHYPGYDAIYQRPINRPDLKSLPSSQGEPPKNCLLINRDHLLPEYFIEYSLESDLDRFTTQLERLLVDIAYSNRMTHSDMPNIVTELSQKLSDSNETLRVMKSDVPLAVLEAEHPDIKLADSLTCSAAETFEPRLFASSVALDHLMISRNAALNPDTFSNRSNIKSISVSHAGLDTLPCFASLNLLEQLDLSFNSIKKVSSSLDNLTNIKFLDLSGNNISDFGSVKYILKTLPLLVKFDLRFNPICKRKGYRFYCICNSKLLQMLDGLPIDNHERGNTDWQSIFFENVSEQKQLFRPLSMRTQVGHGSSSTESEYTKQVMRQPRQAVSHDLITTLELDGCSLFDLDILPESLPSLRWASFRNNYLQNVSKLAQYSRLEELSIENNDIQSIDDLYKLESLTKLDASNNRLISVDTAGQFKSLMLFSLENNFIKSLRPFVKMNTLMEFYIGNNLIVDLFSIFPLKELPRLIILDLTGNTVCKIPNHRLFTIFHISRLKILDGAGITAKEQTQAKEIYLGKLTMELLGEKIGHFTFKNISDLDLRNCKIREVDCLTANDFRNLRRLNFDNNLLVNIDCFTSLVSLRYLSLNNNRIERLLSTDVPSPSIASSSNIFGTKLDPISEPSRGRTLLPHLEELYLGSNQIQRIADLALYRMPQLKILLLQGNKISKIDGMEHLTSLVELILDKNQIKSADPLSFLSLINLKELHIK